MSAREKFDSFVEKSDGCWEWKGKKYENGYACFPFQKDQHLAHRVAYEWENKVSLSRHEVVCHSCDNRKCVRVDHLILADQKFNMQDMASKGRDNPAHGELHVRSKLTEKDVRRMRNLRFRKGVSCKQISKMFSVSQKQVSVVTRGVQWKRIK